jgi:hypothetical protein
MNAKTQAKTIEPATEIATDTQRKPSAQEPHPLDTRGERPTSRNETGRLARIPLGTPNAKLSAPKRAGYVRRWINDMNGRIQAAERAGYAKVEEKGVECVRRVGTLEGGHPLNAHLMEIRQEFYDEDQRAKQARVDEVDAVIKGGKPQGVAPEDQSRFYTPSEGVSLKRD